MKRRWGEMTASQVITEHLPNKMRGTQFYSQIKDLDNIGIDISTKFWIINTKAGI